MSLNLIYTIDKIQKYDIILIVYYVCGGQAKDLEKGKNGGLVSVNRLKCCGRNVQILYTVPLYDTEKQLHRELVVGRCKNSNCGCLKAQIIYWDKVKQTFRYEKIPQKDIAKTIEAYKNSPYLTDVNKPIKQGSKENMFWKYHEKNGVIKDFNGLRVNG